MTLNIFDGSFAFQRTLVDTDSFKGIDRETAPANDRNQFKVSERSKTSATERSRKSDDDFSAFLKSAQDDKKDAETARKDSARTDNTQDARTADKKQAALDKARDAFATQETSGVALVDPAATSAFDEAVESIDVAALLENLSEELRAYIDDLADQAETSSQKIVTDIIVSSDEAAPNVNSLLGLLVSLAGKNEDQPFAQGETVTLADLVQAVQDLTQEDSAQILTSNLTPEELTDIEAKIAAYAAEQAEASDEEELLAIAAQIVSLVEPGGDARKNRDAQAVAIQNTVGDAKAAANNAPLPLPAREAPAAGVQTSAPAPSRFDGRYDVAAQSGQSSQTAADSISTDHAGKTQNTSNAQAQANSNAGVATPTAGEKFLQLLQTSTGALPLADGSIPPQQAGQALQSLPSSQASLTNVITQSPSAVQAHPATQLVSATIQKAVKAGEETNIKLRLDPPELGRVEVKMSIDGDNTAKIVLTVEKPETFLMMQRDADALQRAMAEAGLDTNGDLSFELAGDDHDFEQPQQQGRSDRSSGDEAELIEETTLDVQIDPVTGHVRTDILV